MWKIRPEDQKQTLVFVDMLGFSALTKRLETRVAEERDEAHGFISSYTTDIQNKINVFYRVVNRCFARTSLAYPFTSVMFFSDCVFLGLENSIAAAMIAKEIIRHLIVAHVPARIGLGHGTFYTLSNSLSTTDSISVSQCRFVGTAVVHAHQAEQCGAKGMRILLHPSVREDLTVTPSANTRMLPLPEPFMSAAFELDYLHEQTPLGATPTADDQDQKMFSAVLAMKDPSMPPPILLQYDETLSALNRMRAANGRRHLAALGPS